MITAMFSFLVLSKKLNAFKNAVILSTSVAMITLNFLELFHSGRAVRRFDAGIKTGINQQWRGVD